MNRYDETISTSREESVMRAMDIFAEELKKAEASKIERPDVRVRPFLLRSLFWLAVFLLLGFAAIIVKQRTSLPMWIPLAFWLCLLLVCVLLHLKRILVELILIYQKFAPESIRSACVFEPSCSNYTLLAIEKYGALKGFCKGIKRLTRCHPPNCGEDYP